MFKGNATVDIGGLERRILGRRCHAVTFSTDHYSPQMGLMA